MPNPINGMKEMNRREARTGVCAVLAAAAALAMPACQTSPGAVKAGKASDPKPGQTASAAADTTTHKTAQDRPIAGPSSETVTTAPSRGAREATDPYTVSSTGEVGSSHTRPAKATDRAAQETTSTTLSLYGETRSWPTGAPGAATLDPKNQTGGGLTQASFAPEGADFDPCASRDGTVLVFASTQHRVTSDIYSKTVDGRVVTQLTTDPASDVMPKISPDGSRIAFASNRNGNWDIFVMPTTGGKAMQVTSSPQDELHPAWSPDGRKLVFCRVGEVSTQWELWVTDAQNSGVQHFIGYGLFPEWCPLAGTGAEGSDRILFQKSRERGDRAFCIWTIDYKDGTSGNQTEIATSPTGACINPCWSPDGSWIAFATVPNPTQWARMTAARPSSSDLWMIDAGGGARVRLTGGKGINLMPSWGPDNQLFFVSDLSGVDNIWRLSTQGAVKLALGPGAGAAGSHAAAGTDEHAVTHAAPHAPAEPATTAHDAATPPDTGVANVPADETPGEEH